MNLRRIIICGWLVLTCSICFSQYKVSFVITHLPQYHTAAESIYLVGSFNNWNPGEEKYKLHDGNKPGITIELGGGNYEYKFTKGSWDRVESGNNGFPVENRRIMVDRDTTINVEIEHWADHFPKAA